MLLAGSLSRTLVTLWSALLIISAPAGTAWASPAVNVAEPEPAAAEAVVSPAHKDLLAGEQLFPFEEIKNGNGDEQGEKPGSGPEDCIVDSKGEQVPRIAIIIDDMGYHQRIGNDLLDLDLNLTYSFLPHGPFTAELAERARQQGHDILVHMPMEARDPVWNPGPGTLYLADPLAIRTRNAEKDLSLVPYAVGVNNHMGSRFTEDREAMHQFLDLLKQRNLFFIDSVTSSQSVGMETARAMGIKTAHRHVFLDNIKTQEDICHQLKLLVHKAAKQGWAIGIGHPNEATLTALTRCRAMLRDQVRIVNIRELVR